MKKFKSEYTIEGYVKKGQSYSFEDLLQIIDEMNPILKMYSIDEINGSFRHVYKVNDNPSISIAPTGETLLEKHKKLIERVKSMLNIRKPYTTIIQADGVAMSGNNDEYGTTLQAVATAQMFQNAKIPAYIMMSGGTNTKSIQLAKLCDVHPNCLAVGSYARKIIKKYLENENLFDDKNAIQEAVNIAKSLVDVSLENMG